MDKHKIRDDFFAGNETSANLEIVSPSVLQSWERLRESGKNCSSVFENQSKKTSCEKSETLSAMLSRIAPRARAMTGFPEQSACIVCNSSGGVVAFNGGESIMRQLLDVGWSGNVNMDEESAGTNAVHLCLDSKVPVLTETYDHTLSVFEKSIIAACPLFDDKKNTIGAIGLLVNQLCDPSLTRAISSLCANFLEQTLQVERANSALQRRLTEQRAIADAMTDGLMVVDRAGVVEYMNTMAARILSVDRKMVIGKRLADVLDFEPIISPIFETGVGYYDEELRIKSATRTLHLIDTAVPIKGPDGDIQSVVNTFREFQTVTKVAQKLGGNQAHYRLSDVVGESPSLLAALDVARKAAEGPANVLLTGESGTGKELFAQGIHLASERAQGPFVAINCAALPRDLIEAELFGYSPGSFTGANKRGNPGKFEIASGGTIFLDEISEMPLDVQVKLLRVLQEREVVRVGGTESISVDIRIIAASNKNLRQMIDDSNFRQDLFFRINVIEIPIPALRRRGDDVIMLAELYLKRYARSLDKPAERFSPNVVAALKAHQWPGNVRELQNTIEKLVNLSDEETISVLPFNEGMTEMNSETKSAPEQPASRASIPRFDEMERDLVEQALKACDYNVTKAAETIAVTKPRMYRMIDKHGLKLERTRRRHSVRNGSK